MNISDSQRIATKLDEIGYKSAPEKEADLVIINACSVRQKGLDRIWGKIKNLQKEGKGKILITGCVLKADKRKFEQRNIETFNIKDLANLGNILKESSKNNIDADYFNIDPKMEGRVAYIPIGTGCDNFCSYCAVPYTRGREVSRPQKDIIVEVKKALELGYKEILLLGQNVNSYGKEPGGSHSERSEESPANAGSHIHERSFTAVQDDKVDNQDFIKLLKTIDAIDKDFSFNFMSSNPHDMGDDLIQTFSELKKWPRELHLAMQSGDDEILKKMNRKYTSAQYLKLTENLKLKIKNLKLSTDIIVGFPGETKEQFENTVKLCKKISFCKAYVSQYSPRPGTVSAKIEDDVSAVEKKKRWTILDNLINKKFL